MGHGVAQHPRVPILLPHPAVEEFSTSSSVPPGAAPFRFVLRDAEHKGLCLRDGRLVAANLQGANADQEGEGWEVGAPPAPMGAPHPPRLPAEPISVVPNRHLERRRCPLLVGICDGTKALSCGSGPEPRLRLEVRGGGGQRGGGGGGGGCGGWAALSGRSVMGRPGVGVPRGSFHGDTAGLDVPQWDIVRWAPQDGTSHGETPKGGHPVMGHRVVGHGMAGRPMVGHPEVGTQGWDIMWWDVPWWGTQRWASRGGTLCGGAPQGGHPMVGDPKLGYPEMGHPEVIGHLRCPWMDIR